MIELDYDVVRDFVSEWVSVLDSDETRDMLTFVTSPASVKQLMLFNWEQSGERSDGDDPRRHIARLWEFACFENYQFLEMRTPFPFCLACRKVAQSSHLQSRAHRLQVVARKRGAGEVGPRILAHGPLLTEMLAKEFPHSYPGTTRTNFTGRSWHGRVPPPPPPPHPPPFPPPSYQYQ